MPLHDLVVPPVRLRGCIDQAPEKLALGAAFAAAHLFGIAAGISLRQLRAMNDPLASALARAREAELKAIFASRAVQILGERFDKLPERRRPFYSPQQRFQILELGSLLGWPQDQLARVFRVCTQTIRNWQQHADPDAHAVGGTVRQAPPITRFADVVRNTVHLMSRMGLGSYAMAAAVRSHPSSTPSRESRSCFKRSMPSLAPPPWPGSSSPRGVGSDPPGT